MSDYSLLIKPFQAEDNAACLAEIMEVSPTIGEEMCIEDDSIVFEPDEPFSRWRNEEDKIVPVIMKHIYPGTTCLITWDSVEDGDPGGVLIGRGRKFDVDYEMVAVTDNGNIPMHEAEVLLAGCPDCPFSDTVKQACADGSTSCANEPFSSSWNYHEHGEHVHFDKGSWRQEVAEDNTVLGYQEWVEHQLESLLDDVYMDGVESIMVDICEECENEDVLGSFSVYTKKHQNYPFEVCSFNTMKQAFEVANFLASTRIPVVAIPAT